MLRKFRTTMRRGSVSRRSRELAARLSVPSCSTPHRNAVRPLGAPFLLTVAPFYSLSILILEFGFRLLFWKKKQSQKKRKKTDNPRARKRFFFVGIVLLLVWRLTWSEKRCSPSPRSP